METLDVLTRRAAKLKALSARFASGDKKDPLEARRYLKRMKRTQRKALPLKAAAAAAAKARAEKEKAQEKPAAEPAS